MKAEILGDQVCCDLLRCSVSPVKTHKRNALPLVFTQWPSSLV
uniref:Uncharacterized protein n=1 Tax=Anguilla anguilla TaxID=7936 RepID=A0A0E9PSF9_ANGAN